MTTLVDLIRGFSADENELVFYHSPDKQEILTYHELYCRVMVAARRLRGHGVLPGARVGFCLGTDSDGIVLVLATLYLGAVVVSIKPPIATLGNYEAYLQRVFELEGIRFSAIAQTLPPKVIFLDPAKIAGPGAEEDTAGARFGGCQVDPEAIAVIQFTSGSTAQPKPIPLSHRAIVSNLQQIVQVDHRQRHHWALNVIPLCHDMGLIGGLLANFIHRNSLILVDTDIFLRNPLKVLTFAHEKRVYISPFPVFVLRFLTRVMARSKTPAKVFESFEAIYVGAEPIRRPAFEQFFEVAGSFGLRRSSVIFAYGMAEAALIITYNRLSGPESPFRSLPSGSQIANNGKPVSGTEVTVVTDQEEGGPGRILIRGKSMFTDRTAQRNYVTDWFETGDLGFEENGDLFVVGRDREMVIVDGNNVHCVDVEEHVAQAFNCSDVVACCDEDTISLLLVTKHQPMSDANAVKASVKGAFGLIPKLVAYGRSTHVARSTSGKPIKAATLSNIRAILSVTHA